MANSKYEVLSDHLGTTKVYFDQTTSKQITVVLGSNFKDSDISFHVQRGLDASFFDDKVGKEKPHIALSKIAEKGRSLLQKNAKKASNGKFVKSTLVVVKEGKGMPTPQVNKTTQKRLAKLTLIEALGEEKANELLALTPETANEDQVKEIKKALGLPKNSKKATVFQNI